MMSVGICSVSVLGGVGKSIKNVSFSSVPKMILLLFENFSQFNFWLQVSLRNSAFKVSAFSTTPKKFLIMNWER